MQMFNFPLCPNCFSIILVSNTLLIVNYTHEMWGTLEGKKEGLPLHAFHKLN